ncbi:hypothetical protein BD769DRAFT_998111 [Suillus cothurnatus]|nr:hypothetical protein BD769DRAFT_998111 [Suillus cothurnatus]
MYDMDTKPPPILYTTHQWIYTCFESSSSILHQSVQYMQLSNVDTGTPIEKLLDVAPNLFIWLTTSHINSARDCQESYTRLEAVCSHERKNLKFPSFRIPVGIYISISGDSKIFWKLPVRVLSSGSWQYQNLSETCWLPLKFAECWGIEKVSVCHSMNRFITETNYCASNLLFSSIGDVYPSLVLKVALCRLAEIRRPFLHARLLDVRILSVDFETDDKIHHTINAKFKRHMLLYMTHLAFHVTVFYCSTLALLQ